MALMDRRLKDPWGVRFKDDNQKRDFTHWLCDNIEAAYNARIDIIGPYGQLDYNHWLYEMGKTPEKAKRFPGAADLNSSIVCEKVDALRARIVRTIFTEPVWTVEGWGKDAEKAPFAEEFHQWKLEEERLQQYLSKTIHSGLIEQNGILEILDRADVRLVTQLQKFAAMLTEGGDALIGEDNKPQIQTDEQGTPVPWSDEQTPYVEARTATYKTQRKGPGYRVISQRDFLFLPGHAADEHDLFGYAKRCFVRMGALAERVKLGVYPGIDVKDLERLSPRTTIQPGLERQGMSLAEQRDSTEEKELWDVLVLYDCDGDGLEEWYVCTVSVIDRVLLRIRKDDWGLPRYLPFTPFPRPDSVYGYSFVGDKLCTIAEEDTALRNMIADRSTMATNPPIVLLTNALWNPRSTPWGTGAIIRARQPNEIQPLTVPDVPQSAFVQRSLVKQSADAVAGLNDTAVGVTQEERRTATENSIVAQAAAVRTDEVVKNIQESLETLWLIRNELWIRTLEESPNGMEAPDTVIRTIETRGLEIQNGRFTSNMLRGNLRGKPRGSVETADKNKQRQDFGQSLQALAMLAKMIPQIGMVFQNPEAAEALIVQWARLFNVPERQAFVDPIRKMAQAAQAQMRGGMPGMMPGQPPMLGPGGAPDLQALLQAMPPEMADMLMNQQAGGVQ